MLGQLLSCLYRVQDPLLCFVLLMKQNMNLWEKIRWKKFFHYFLNLLGRLGWTTMKWGKRVDSTIAPLLTSRLADRTGKNGKQRDLFSDSLESKALLAFYEHQEERNTLKNPGTQECIRFPSSSRSWDVKNAIYIFLTAWDVQSTYSPSFV